MDQSFFFPERNDAESGNIAKMTCFGCPVRVQCDEYRVETNSKYGIWAGKQQKRGE